MAHDKTQEPVHGTIELRDAEGDVLETFTLYESDVAECKRGGATTLIALMQQVRDSLDAIVAAGDLDFPAVR